MVGSKPGSGSSKSSDMWVFPRILPNCRGLRAGSGTGVRRTLAPSPVEMTTSSPRVAASISSSRRAQVCMTPMRKGSISGLWSAISMPAESHARVSTGSMSASTQRRAAA